MLESTVSTLLLNTDVSVIHPITVKRSEINLQDAMLNLDDLTLYSDDQLFDHYFEATVI